LTLTHRRLAFATLLLFGCNTLTMGNTDSIVLPNIGETAESYLSTEDEQRYGEEFMRSIRRSLDLVTDPEIQNYVEALGNRLVASSGVSSGRKFSFFVVRDPSINAFAGPGGYIGVHSGLFITGESEAELASVMAHEIAHVTQRHIARAFEDSSRMSVPMTAAIIAAIILGSRAGSGQAGEAAIAASLGGSIQRQINFTRANEQEADRVGLQILADAGYEPRAMPRFFEHLQQASIFYDDGLQLEFLRTHPVTIARISDTRNRAEQYPELRESISDAFPLIREKVRVLQEANPDKSLVWYEGALAETKEGTKEGAKENERDALRYGYAVALNAAGRYAEASAQLTSLAKREPERVAYQIALAEAALGQSRIDEALIIYERSLGLYPYHLPLTLYYAHALLQNGQAEKAAQVIDNYTRARSQRPELYRLLAQARDAMKDPLGARQALAEYYYLRGDMRAALEQLQMALRLVPKSDVRATRLTARIESMRNEWRIRAKFSGEVVPEERPNR
jgi:predicted Zn-dependent protease